MVSMPGMGYGLRGVWGFMVILWETLQGAILFYATRSVVPLQIMALKGSPVHNSAVLSGSVQHPQEPPQSCVPLLSTVPET
ncbi:hypothetical protein QBC34DRAFT_15380 [Podospora aff. communis PSN243]|uniref:Uncharacterized protein n=1 Tax=Podospora aff. communis PSN243 TaxID=3040156 RepID=A0AAV9H6I2_9PEZI|nr:hypothetical protein QBC34DRAFT_15380 [Podospora aff. communis PSN243]